MKLDVLLDGFEGFMLEVANASRLIPSGSRISVPEPAGYAVHPVHLAVNCQWDPLTLVPDLKT